MARSKNYLTYPDSFADLVTHAVVRKFEIELEDEAAARRLMGRLYGYFQALDIAIKDPKTPEEIRNLRRMSYKVRLQVHGNRFVAYPGDEEPINRALIDELKKQGTDEVHPASQSAIGPSEDLLRKLRGESAHDE